MIFCKDLCKSRTWHMRNISCLHHQGSCEQPLPLVCPSLAITSHTLCKWTPGQCFGMPHTGLPTGVNCGGQGGAWGHCREGDCGGKDGSRVRNVWVSLGRGKEHSWLYSNMAFLGEGWRCKILLSFLMYFMIMKELSFFFFPLGSWWLRIV